MRLLPPVHLLFALPLCAQWGTNPPTASDWRAGILNGQAIHYVEKDGSQIFEGDILLAPAAAKSSNRQAIASLGTGGLWTNATVPYVMDGDTPLQDGIRQAMSDWSAATSIRFVPRTDQKNYVHFRRAAAGTCTSYVGMIGGEQFISYGADCGGVALYHEIGHALGLWHEQTRHDRSAWITLYPRNINKQCIYNYEIPAFTRDLGAYDFASVMHYFAYAYSSNGLPAMETIPPGIPISSTAALSAGDIANVRLLYQQPRRIYVSAFPAGASFEVDGVAYDAVQAFDWQIGSTHTITAVEAKQLSESTRLVFGRWTDNGERSHSITVDEDTSYYTASFIRQYRVTTSIKLDGSSGSGSVELSPQSPDGFYREGEIVLATAKATPGNSFWQWRGIDKPNQGTYLEDGSFAVGPTNPRYFAVNMPKDIVATITTVPVITIQTDPPNLNISIDGNPYRAPQILRNVLADQWQPGTQHTIGIPVPIQTCRVLCEPGTRWVFQGWKHGGDRDQTITAPNGGTTYTAVFQRQLRVTADASSGSVKLDPESRDGFYPEGTLLTATPLAGADRRFSGWFNLLIDVDLPGGQFRSTSASCTAPARIRMNEPYDLYANNEILKSFTPPPIPVVNAEATQNAAGRTTGPIAPGEMIQLSGRDFGASGGFNSTESFTGFLDTCLGQTTFYFDGTPAAVLSRDTGGAQVVVPYAVAGKSSVSLVVESRGTRSVPVTLSVADAAPAIFTTDDSGAGLIYHDGYVPVTGENPASPDETVLLFATGLGITDPPSLDGQLADANTPLKPLLPLTLTIGAAEAEILNAVSVPGQVSGLFQITVRIPGSAASGVQPVVLKAGSVAASQKATIAIR